MTTSKGKSSNAFASGMMESDSPRVRAMKMAVVDQDRATRAVIAKAPLMRLDREMKVTEWNASLSELTGYSSED